MLALSFLRHIASRSSLGYVNFSHLFVVGFNKTATTAIHHLFQESGFRSVHWDQGKLAKAMMRNISQGKPVFRGYDRKYEIFSDLTARGPASWIEGNEFFPQMAHDYPSAGFLYNYRDIDEWLISRSNHLGNFHGKSLMSFHLEDLGFPSSGEVLNHWRQKREAFESRLHGFFQRKPHRLASLDIESSQFVGNLESFIGEELAAGAWEQVNVSDQNQRKN